MSIVQLPSGKGHRHSRRRGSYEAMAHDGASREVMAHEVMAHDVMPLFGAW
jgi:hypothetical protein